MGESRSINPSCRNGASPALRPKATRDLQVRYRKSQKSPTWSGLDFLVTIGCQSGEFLVTRGLFRVIDHNHVHRTLFDRKLQTKLLRHS